MVSAAHRSTAIFHDNQVELGVGSQLPIPLVSKSADKRDECKIGIFDQKFPCKWVAPILVLD